MTVELIAVAVALVSVVVVAAVGGGDVAGGDFGAGAVGVATVAAVAGAVFGPQCLAGRPSTSNIAWPYRASLQLVLSHTGPRMGLAGWD